MEKRDKITIGLIIILVITFAAALFMEKQRLDRDYSQLASVRWEGSGDGRAYSQVSVFYDKNDSPGLEDIKRIRNDINQSLKEDSLLEADSQGRTWIDAYSGAKPINIRKDSNTIQVNAFFVGGDFFQIHPIKLKDGNYPDSNDLQILLDENVAWNLFGGSNISGMKVWIGDTVATVSGVVEYEDSKISDMALGNMDTVYIPYDAYASLMKTESAGQAEETMESSEQEVVFADADEVSQGVEGSNGSSGAVDITCYEAVLPNPIKNYGCNVVTEANGVDLLSDEEAKKQRSTLNFEGKEIIENSSRYNILSLIERLKERRYAEMRTNSVAYPYWENMARYEETRCSHILMAGCVLAVFCAATVLRKIKKKR